jgi:hypothetical protein
MAGDQTLNQIPSELVGGLANLSDLIVALAMVRRATRSDADRVVAILPAALKSAPCFLDRLTATWRYIFGNPLFGLPNGQIVLLPNGQIVLGTHMYHEVLRLFDVLACAQRRLTSSELSTYFTALGNPEKHEDALVEFAPIVRLDRSFEVAYEVPGAGNATIDWQISAPEGKTLLLEVKNRMRDLFEGLCQVQAHSGTVDTPPEPAHDPYLLFRSIEKKFLKRKVGEPVQAVWIKTAYRQEESELQVAFDRLDPERVQVAILGDWGDDAYVLANDVEAKQLVIRILHVSESRRFVFQRGVPVQGQ